MDWAGLCGELRFCPGLKTSVEDVDVLGAEGAEHPPGSGGGVDAGLLVDDDGRGVGDAESGHAAGGIFRVGGEGGGGGVGGGGALSDRAGLGRVYGGAAWVVGGVGEPPDAAVARVCLHGVSGG